MGLQLQSALTPLTTFVVSGERSSDRFDFTPARDTDSWRAERIRPAAVRADGGRGRVGYRRFTGTGGALPEYSGVVATVAAGSTVRSRTRIEFTTDRDVSYSWEVAYPYYVRTGATVTVTPQLTTRWDVRARLGTQHLAYRAVTGVPGLRQDRRRSSRPDRRRRGYRVGPDIRVGAGVDWEHRESPVLRHAYEAYRTGVSVSYGR